MRTACRLGFPHFVPTSRRWCGTGRSGWRATCSMNARHRAFTRLNHNGRATDRPVWRDGRNRNGAFKRAVLFWWLCWQANTCRSPRAAKNRMGNRDCGRCVDQPDNHDGGRLPAAARCMPSRARTSRHPRQRCATRCRQTASRNSPAISASFRCGANISISRYAYARRNAPLRSPTRVVLASNRCCVSSATSPVSRCGS